MALWAVLFPLDPGHKSLHNLRDFLASPYGPGQSGQSLAVCVWKGLRMSARRYPIVFCLFALLAGGCNSPYHADRGALVGGLLGAGTGAVVGNALGSTAAGAAIGAGVGALGGAAVGSGMDEIEARNRAMIAQQMGREVRAGAVTVDDVVMMSQAGVDEELIVNHIRSNGVARVPGAQELVELKQQGVPVSVIRAMQAGPPPPAAQPVVVREVAPPPVIVEERIYGPPPCYYPPPYYHRHHPPHVSWGVSVHDF
jgi:hypothetical protein